MTNNDSTQGPDRDFVEFIVKQLVSNPDEVTVIRTVDEMGVLITLKVSKEDMGRIIGKNGQTAKSIRVLLRVVGSKNNARVNLKIVEPDGKEVPISDSLE
ncbi:KH domain-containing protein [Candidatus Peregrinibacteria bacterium]|nr:KH domain-containing protein [Candidatus Peregrinibacteria bacterium]